MQVAIFGLGKMGMQIAKRLYKSGFTVLAWNRSQAPRDEAVKAGIKVYGDVAELVKSMHKPALTPRPPLPEVEGESDKVACGIFWLMLPHEIVSEFLDNQLSPHLKSGDIVIDGGNSFYQDSLRRAKELKRKGVVFFDCGTSGGVWGEKNGFALMVGGPKEAWPMVEPIFKALSSGDNYGLVGENGAGHFVKMVHNGIEYGMMEALAEGYAVLEASPFKLNLGQVTKIYQQGSVVRSWLVDLLADIFKRENLGQTSGLIENSGEGEWTIKTAQELGVDARVIKDAFKVRQESADPKNQQKFSNKIVALLRKQFGGHKVKKN